MPYAWGVDSAATVNRQLLQCVLDRFGKPQFWGRYLSTVPRAAEGLTREEIDYLHSRGIRVLPIYNAFRRATGYHNGSTVAKQAVHHAVRLGIPRGKAIMANIEHFFKVDEGWIRGWMDTIRGSGYRPGIYHDPTRGDFAGAYCAAVRKNPLVNRTIQLWSAQPERTVTGPRNAPAYEAARPRCARATAAWQYGRDSKLCPIDTNLMDYSLYAMLY